MKVVRLSVPHTSHIYPPGDILGTHFCYRLSLPQSNSAAGRIKSMKNSNDTIGNWTHDLLVCSTVPQPTASPRDPKPKGASNNLSNWMCWYCCAWNGITRNGQICCVKVFHYSWRLQFEKSRLTSIQWSRRYSFHYHQTICNNNKW